MTKMLVLYLADGVTVQTPTDFGSVNPGTTAASRNLILKNTGTEAIPSIRARIEQTTVADGEYKVTAASKLLTAVNQELLTAALAVGATVAISESWTTPAGVSSAVDTGTLVIDYDQ